VTYSYAEIEVAYRAAGVHPGATVMLTADLGRLLDRFETPGKDAVCEAHVRALRGILGPEGTLVVCTASTNLCNSDEVFDIETTPSFNMGVMSEHIRKLAGANRSFHPTGSYAAIGRFAPRVVENVSRHVYGPKTPEARLIELDALCVSIGLHPRFTCTTVHHVEHVMGVPYRYTKEFVHRVRRGQSVVTEEFYRNVWYRDMDLKRDINEKIFADLERSRPLKIAPLGRGRIYSYPICDFYENTVNLFAQDPYVWCAEPPKSRPYRL
jgi:aminoglycoside 3-N-acetyltransferase